jgi:hypothetical protein
MGVTCRDAFLLVGRDLLGGDLRDELLREQRVQVVEVRSKRQIYGRVSSLERAILQQSGCTDNSTYARLP